MGVKLLWSMLLGKIPFLKNADQGAPQGIHVGALIMAAGAPAGALITDDEVLAEAQTMVATQAGLHHLAATEAEAGLLLVAAESACLKDLCRHIPSVTTHQDFFTVFPQ
eukprot:TRINITY_DN4008_c0_g1_i2.p2 TRINITY_DN4008_c0_g1~~TRINITY_DN4008_c0_g1_i2.p2  ORF type:complete len:109 (-),score=3.28 TRINITY_DN4008_c0_g1_i2:155-481(-)